MRGTIEDAMGYLNLIVRDESAVVELVRGIALGGNSSTIDIAKLTNKLMGERPIKIELIFGLEALAMGAVADVQPAQNVVRINMEMHPVYCTLQCRRALTLFYLIVLLHEYVNICTDTGTGFTGLPSSACDETLSGNVAMQSVPTKPNVPAAPKIDDGAQFKRFHLDGLAACISQNLAISQVIDAMLSAHAIGNLRLKSVPLTTAEAVLTRLDQYFLDKTADPALHFPADAFHPIRFDHLPGPVTTSTGGQPVRILSGEFRAARTPQEVEALEEQATRDAIAGRLNISHLPRNPRLRW